MSFDWNDYSADSDTEDVSLLLSARSQSLILAAMRNLDSRMSWVEVDDVTWDDIDAAVAEAYEEIMEIQILGTQGGFRARRTTNQNVGSPVSTWNNVIFDTVDEDNFDFTPEALPIGYFNAPASGVYLIGWNVQWQANTSTDSFLRSSRLIIDGTVVIAQDTSLVVNEIFAQAGVAWYPINAASSIRLQCFTEVPNLNIVAAADFSAVLWAEKIR